MIYVIGIGPGGIDQITPRAYDTLNKCILIMGYYRYIDLIKDYLPNSGFYSFPMGSERERCIMALDISRKFHKDVALISSGDAGVYGMAGLMLEVAAGSGEQVEIIPGITAANSCAAILGAPLMNDYVTISLSDIMTDWEIIEKRLIAACYGDLVVCIYNPASKHRPDNFTRACKILMDNGRSPDTPSGYVSNIDRERESRTVTTLAKIMDMKIDMLCTVIIGNSQSYILGDKIITARGYNISNSNEEADT